MKTEKNRVSIGMPIYKGGTYIDEAVESILKQSWTNFDVLMSIDNNDLESAEICKKYLTDPRFKLHIHKTKLGWLRNIEWLMNNQNGAYWFYFQQDDILKKEYIKTLITHAQKNPKAVVSYCDIKAFGNLDRKFHQKSVVGSAVNREIDLLRHHLPAVAFRGLVRKKMIKTVSTLRQNECDSFCCDTTWMSTMARFGELHRVPKLLYKKRYHSTNTHTAWRDRSQPQLDHAWAVHCVDMLLESLPVAHTIPDKLSIFKAAAYRLLRSSISGSYIQTSTWKRYKKLIYIFTFMIIFGRKYFKIV